MRGLNPKRSGEAGIIGDANFAGTSSLGVPQEIRSSLPATFERSPHPCHPPCNAIRQIDRHHDSKASEKTHCAPTVDERYVPLENANPSGRSKTPSFGEAQQAFGQIHARAFWQRSETVEDPYSLDHCPIRWLPLAKTGCQCDAVGHSPLFRNQSI